MKIIDIGICVDNIDPKGLGRIRCKRYNDYVGEKEKAIDYQFWSDRDPFVANPFLPSNINMIPEIGQAVKVLNYNTQKEGVNQEYIAGPFTTMYDYNSQKYAQQVSNTSYGVSVKDKPNVRSTNGEYLEEVKNVFAKENDFAIYGKYGSDILFTENGLQLRGGKLLHKDSAGLANKLRLATQPIYSPNKQSKISLKKFPKKAEIETSNNEVIEYEESNIRTIIEYEINSLESFNEIRFFVYNVVNTLGGYYSTTKFKGYTELDKLGLKLINTTNDDITPTYTITTNSLTAVPTLVKDTIFNISQKGLKYLDDNFTSEDIHPFYYRPTKNFVSLSGSTIQLQDLKNNLLNKIIINNTGPTDSLYWSKDYPTQIGSVKNSTTDYLRIDENSLEQTFLSMISDKIYLVSTDSNESQKNVNFNALDKYEFTQEDYILNIDKNTYSMVRGENLLILLNAIINVLKNHKHNVVGTYVTDGFDAHENLENLLKNVENDILNKSIKIN